MKYILAVLIVLVSCTDHSLAPNLPVDHSEDHQIITRLLDNWHQAAAIADEDIFFGSISENGIYLGTDKTERWEKQEFESWSSKYFDRDTAWAFTPFDRTIYFSREGKTAWFEESLETWMGHCRGSGVVQKNDSIWQIEHYNLAVTIDNDKIDGFIDLTNGRSE